MAKLKSGTTIGGSTAWHASNDGSGSGLDADLLDGQQGSYYTGYTDTAIANLVASAPGTLDTLNELAAALGDDPNFATTVTNSIATKLPLAGGTMTGHITMGTNAIYGASTSYALDFNSTDITMSSVGDIWLYADSNDNETTRYINLAAGQNTLRVYGGAGSQTDSITYNGNKVWHAGNDGSGSGLDADLLDGNHASAFALSGHTHSYLPLTGGTLTGDLIMSSADIHLDGIGQEITFGQTSGTVGYIRHVTGGQIQIGSDNFIDFYETDSNVLAVSISTNDKTVTASGGFIGNASSASKWATARTNTVTLTGDVTGSGSASVDGSANWTVSFATTVGNDSHNHSIDTITDEYRVFNNMGNNHNSYTNFNSFPNFGHYYAQGGTNGPTGSGSDQFYGMFLGLGNEYSSTQYGSQFYWGRQATGTADKYIWIRDLENGNWQSWRKPYVGKADAWTTARTNTVTLTGDVTGSGSASVDGSGNWTVSIASDWRGGTANVNVALNDNKLYLRTDGDNNHYLWNNASDYEELVYYTGTGFRVTSSIGTQTALFKESGLEINGLLTATQKSFTIDHPTKPGMKLRYGSLEGPENGVYVRGRLQGTNTIELPEYWTKLVDPESITVQLTAMGRFQKLYVKEILDNKVVIGNGSWFSNNTDCFYIVYAERVDVDKLEVEIY